MINGYPIEEELRSRILRQLDRCGPIDTVVLIWHGYLSALLEWGLLEGSVYRRLSSLLPLVGNKALVSTCKGRGSDKY
jgi:hypothetical protein